MDQNVPTFKAHFDVATFHELLGSKNKLKRFKENEAFTNVIQPTREEVITHFPLKGKWHSFFENNNPIVVELGCGKGEYTIALARKNPNKNYVGIDIKGARFWRGAKTALEEKSFICLENTLCLYFNTLLKTMTGL